VRSIYEALNRGDSDAATHLTDANFEVTFQRGPNAGTHRGRASIQAIVEDQRAAFDAWIIEVERVVERDGQLVAVIKSRLRPRGHRCGVRDSRRAHLDDPRWRCLARVPSPEEALEAAGLRE
jgi:ketosteroid isomerase-like protein